MEQAWLDSLSEDWNSQPRSSGSPAPSLPSLINSTSHSSNARLCESRIPKYSPPKQSWTAAHDGNNSPLSERSLNENNIPLSQRALRRPSKLRGEISNSTRGLRLSRTVSASTTQSTQCHTIQHHKSVSLSPKKSLHETPEWKRRLLHGDVAYGEQRDLFSPAGLENIFRPPPTQSPSPRKPPIRDFGHDSVAMPSSPPIYNICRSTQETESEMSMEEQKIEENRNSQKPRVMKYKLADEGCSEFSADDLSRSTTFQPVIPTSRREKSQESLSDPVSDFSAVQQGDNGIGAGRTTSGQSDFRNEELSPIYISRHNTVDGNIDYYALDLPAAELQQRLENLQVKDCQQSIDDAEDASQVLLGDMTVETDDYAHNGRFVNIRRGGHSQEGSFQKRMLSPSSLPAIDESAMLPEESMQASTPKQLPNIRKTRSSAEYEKYHEAQISPPVPRTPHPSPTKSDAKGHKIHKSSSGSPLKIFGTYDTFTNQKLLRRLSQFEGDFEDNEDISSPSVQESTHPEMNEAFVAASSPDKVSQRSHIHHHSSRRVNSFGKGDLDDFQFSEEISYDSNRSNVEDEDKENISLPVLDPSTQTRFKFHLDPSPALEEEEFTQRRTTYTNTTSTTKQTISVRKTVRPGTGSSGTSTAPPTSQLVEDLETPRKRNGNSEGKRLPKSPLKDPTPKRRRTWHKPDIAQAMANEETVELDSLRETHQQMQSVIGRKRKDARHDDDQQAANPKVLAMRQILRPRTPTPSQRSSQHHERVPLAEVNLSSAERVRFVQEEKIAMIQAELDSTNPLKISTALGVSQQMHDNSRKGSVTTQDFLDEAKKIMAGIRGKARPRSGLTSLEESESENDRNRSSAAATQDDELEDSYQESTKEPFSRPPSREGMPVPRIPLKQQDPELLDHLRKYEEMSEMDGVIVSSIKSLAMAKEAANTAKEIGRITQETISRASGRSLNQADTVECEPPNIRISENPELYRKRKHSTSSVLPGDDEHHEADFPSYGSNGSSNQSTSRSIPTGSSRGSDSRRVVIAPQSVSHLIPAQLAGMVFDREQNVWVRRKAVSGAGGEHNFLPSDETEDDPFGDIPDLSVDETQELQRIKEVAARRKEEARVAQINAHGKQEAAQPRDDRFKPANIGSNPEDVFSSEPSKLTRFASSGTVPEFNTRLTSWGDEHAPVSRLSQHLERKQEAHQSLKYAQTETREGVVEEFEREISIHEDRIDQNSPQRRRNVTISFSSPLASVIQPSSYDDDNDFNEDEVAQSDSDDHEENGNGSVIISKRGSKQKAPLTSMRTAFRNASRHISIGGHKFSTRPVSRIDEQDEDSLNRDGDGPRRRSISIVVATPGRSRREASLVLATPRPAHEIGTLSLTPLSDFTMNQADDSFGMEVSYIAGGQRYVPGGNTKRTLSLSIKELVEKLTEVEPYEPFWEHIRQMDLKDKKLTNLHKLDEFCEQLEDLDISNNQISHLNGAPRTLRHLRITHNYLSDLTAWGHLSNLQYIDVSNNQLESLSAFQCLIHLRGLRADNNKIKSLEGIGQLDGLLSLRLRGNMIDSLDLGGSKLQRLTDLDLKDNNIRDARNLQDLRSLSTLNLENNDLCNFPSDESKLLWALKYLKLSGNNLESIDVSRYPNLRLLYLDRNRLGTVTGLLKTKHLDSLSMREQQEGAVIDPSFLSEAFEVRKLFLSGNLLNTFKPLVDFLNLQYLELANCGLETLPVEFGQMVSNIRVLNLNFNALKDIKPLLGIIRLKKLHVAGNRLSRLRKSMNVLAQFPNLTLADLRGNPLTLGFYPPVMERGLIVHDSGGDEESNVPEPFTLVKADMGMDEKYASRLDMDTRMLRRVYEILVLGGCARLRLLDGLRVDKSVLNLRDKVWEALVRADVVNGAVGDTVCEGNQQEKIGEREVVSEPKSPQTPVPEERWQAEDSFA